jgi:hypothetical protein
LVRRRASIRRETSRRGEHVVLPERLGEERRQHGPPPRVAHHEVVEVVVALRLGVVAEGGLERAQPLPREAAPVAQEPVPLLAVQPLDAPLVLQREPGRGRRGAAPEVAAQGEELAHALHRVALLAQHLGDQPAQRADQGLDVRGLEVGVEHQADPRAPLGHRRGDGAVDEEALALQPLQQVQGPLRRPDGDEADGHLVGRRIKGSSRSTATG